MRKLSILFLGVCLSIAASAQENPYLFRLLDTESGLPDNQVRNMTMLPDGMMCIQTSSMLNLYDGSSCRSYAYNPIEIPYTEYSGLTSTFYDRKDNLLWCTTRDNIWIFNLNTREFEYDIRSRLSGYGFEGDDAAGLFIDDDDDFWIMSDGGELWFCNRRSGAAEKISLPEGMTTPIVFEQYNDIIWMLSLNGTLAEYDRGIKTFRSVKRNLIRENNSSHLDIEICSKGDVWIMYNKNLLCYNPKQDEIQEFDRIRLGKRDLFTSMAMDHEDRLWVGTARSGVSIVSCNDKSVTTLPYLEQKDGKKIYHHTDISQIYADHRKGVWVATLSEGLLYWSQDIYNLHTINGGSLSGGQMPDESVKCMTEDKDGDILIGTIKGLLRYNPKTNSMNIPYEELKDELCISLYRDSRDRIWLGTFYNGAFCIDNGRIRHYWWPEYNTVDASYLDSSPNYNCVRSFYEDDKGNFWISVYGGIGKFDPETGDISMLRDRHPEIERFMIVRDICTHKDGHLLVCGDNGSFIYSPEEDKVWLSENDNRQSNQAIADDRNLLWTATAGGLAVTDLDNDKEYMVEGTGGLGNSGIMSLACDDLGNIWASTFSKISRISAIRTEEGYNFAVSTFNKEDGVRAGAFFQKSVLKHSSGDIYFGGAHGITAVSPKKLYQENYKTSPVISSVSVNGKTLASSEKELTLSHDESFISFTFSNLNYANPTHTTYKYKLENFDRDWNTIYSQALGRATYTYLEPGDYEFKAIAANNDSDWSEEAATVRITIRPPFYQSDLAYLIYTLLIIGICFITYKAIVKSARKKLIDKQRQEMQRQRENLDQMKFRFFTNISHELRTPLSLILLPLESMMKEVTDKQMLSRLETMHGNARQLLQLVNHLLDFRKLEMGGEKLELVNGNIGEFTENILNYFRDAADKKGISIEYEDNTHSPIMAFDKAKIQKIINNLLSNALKFTSDGGHISVRLYQSGTEKGDMLSIEVADSGVGIPQKDLANIFDRFYQSRNAADVSGGSGIGLSIVKQYAEMHGGSVHVESEQGKGTCFRIEIPMWLKTGDAESVQPMEEDITAEPADITAAEKKYSILVVDDNDDFRNYLSGTLSRNYEVYCAKNGEECIELINRKEPDILISDVMMPGIDGFEVTRRLKTNIMTSHIPVILLTARASDETRLKGYENGADAYITKPFQMELLEARIRNLIDERRKRISDFSKSSDITPSAVSYTTVDEKLMTQIIESIERNIGNPNYSVEELSSDVCMHRMNLYRKLQSLCGMTPSEFIRTMRLKRAAQILKTNPTVSITELAESVGFNVTRYFTKHFKEMYGVTPSQYRDN